MAAKKGAKKRAKKSGRKGPDSPSNSKKSPAKSLAKYAGDWAQMVSDVTQTALEEQTALLKKYGGHKLVTDAQDVAKTMGEIVYESYERMFQGANRRGKKSTK